MESGWSCKNVDQQTMREEGELRATSLSSRKRTFSFLPLKQSSTITQMKRYLCLECEKRLGISAGASLLPSLGWDRGKIREDLWKSCQSLMDGWRGEKKGSRWTAAVLMPAGWLRVLFYLIVTDKEIMNICWKTWKVFSLHSIEEC